MIFKNYAQATAPKLSKNWKTRETFKGYPSNVPRVVSLSFNPETYSALSNKIFAFAGKNFFKNFT